MSYRCKALRAEGWILASIQTNSRDNVFCFKLQAKGSTYLIQEYYNYLTFVSGSISYCGLMSISYYCRVFSTVESF